MSIPRDLLAILGTSRCHSLRAGPQVSSVSLFVTETVTAAVVSSSEVLETLRTHPGTIPRDSASHVTSLSAPTSDSDHWSCWRGSTLPVTEHDNPCKYDHRPLVTWPLHTCHIDCPNNHSHQHNGYRTNHACHHTKRTQPIMTANHIMLTKPIMPNNHIT